MANIYPGWFQISSETDYDFYATYSTEIESFLLKNEFYESSHGGYELDTEAVIIYKKDNVDVILRKNAEMYHRVFSSIDPDIYYHLLWKSSPDRLIDKKYIQLIFNTLFKIARTEKEAGQKSLSGYRTILDAVL